MIVTSLLTPVTNLSALEARASRARSATRGSSAGPAGGGPRQAGLAEVQPPVLRLGGQDQPVQRQQPGDVVGGVRLVGQRPGPEPGVLADGPPGVVALRPDDR